MLWRDLKPGDVLHVRSSRGDESFLVIDDPRPCSGCVFVPVVSLDTGEEFSDHYKPDGEVEWPWTLE